jgi:hypothetical protein
MHAVLNAAMQQVHGSIHESFTHLHRLCRKSGQSVNFPLSAAAETATFA